MKRLYVDMDGVLAVFNNQIESEEVLYQEGYYRDLPPQENVVEAVRRLTTNPEIEVFILSAVLPSPYAEKEKNEWLDRFLPEIDQAHRLFVPCGEDKGAYIGHELGDDDLLLDDYSKNLHAWCPPGRAIKLRNDINGRFGTWKGATVHYMEPPSSIAEKVMEKLFSSRDPATDLSVDDKAKEPSRRYVIEVTRRQYGALPVMADSFEEACEKAQADVERGTLIDWYDYDDGLTFEDATDFYLDELEGPSVNDAAIKNKEVIDAVWEFIDREFGPFDDPNETEYADGVREKFQQDVAEGVVPLAYSTVYGFTEQETSVQVSVDINQNQLLFEYGNGQRMKISYQQPVSLIAAVSNATFDSLIGDAESHLSDFRRNDQRGALRGAKEPPLSGIAGYVQKHTTEVQPEDSSQDIER